MRRNRLTQAAVSSARTLGVAFVATLALVVALGLDATAARAARVIVLGPGGHARTIDDPFVSGSGPLGAPPPPALGALGGADGAGAGANVFLVAARAARSSGGPTVVSVLAQLARRHQITPAQHAQYLGDFTTALADQTELTAVTETLHQIAADRQLTPSRLPALFLTLERNTQWWTTGPLLAPDQRVQFAGSQIVWEYYPGQGIQMQALGTFGEADAFYTAGPSQYGALQSVLGEMLPLAVAQDHGITWDYYFTFDGGVPPWTSAMADGTALVALSRAYLATGNHAYLVDGAELLPVLRDPPPRGLAVPTASGLRYLQYSFAPNLDIINAFLQTLIGLYTFSHVSGNLLSLRLFNAGNAEAQAELPSFNTGAWSLYQPGVEDTLSYHQLVTGFLEQLCSLTIAPVYCQTSAAFQTDLKTPPALAQLTLATAPKRTFAMTFGLSKASHVGIVISGPVPATAAGQSPSGAAQGPTVFSTSGDYAHGTNAIRVPALKAGTYVVHLTATDLAGNFARITGTLTVAGSRTVTTTMPALTTPTPTVTTPTTTTATTTTTTATTVTTTTTPTTTTTAGSGGSGTGGSGLPG
jgi:hypothetical protein